MTGSDNEWMGKPAAPQGRTRVLVIDDDRKLCRLIRDYLEPMGYDVSAAHSGTEGVERAAGEAWDAVILDVMLPGQDGFEALKAIRRTSDVPVLMLTARGEEADRIVGLEMGADDYLPKTFSTRELLARLRAVMRRARSASPNRTEEQEIVVGPLRINPGSRDYDVFDRSVDVHISALRKKLGDDPKTPRFIRTVRSAGYMCLEPDDA